ncbi:MAG: hypothetical protein ACJAZM_000340 [Cyclobacteriaceae bacterium]|jgi:hypothetical protein
METAYRKDKKISERLHMISEVLVHIDLLRPIQKRVLDLIPSALFFTISSSLAIGFYLISIDQYQDLGIDILVELVGVFFTIYIVGFFFNKHKHVKNVPFRVVAWKHTANVFDRHFLFWKTAYQKRSVKMYDGPEDFLNRESFLEMRVLLDLNQPVEKGRDATWRQMIQKVAIATQRDLM